MLVTTYPIIVRPTDFKNLDPKRMRQYYSRILECKNGELGYKNPLPAVRLDGYYIIGEGHHTCSTLYLLERPVKLSILETDKDVKHCNIGYFKHFQDRRSLVMELRELMVGALKEGIVMLYDLRIKFAHDDLVSLAEDNVLDRLLRLKIPEEDMSQQRLGSLSADEENIRRLSA